MRRRRLLGFLAAGTLGLAVASTMAPSAGAIEAPGSGFLSLNLQARAGGLMVDADEAADQAPGSARGGVPFTEATASGFNSRALSSVAWPGALGGNLGKLLTLAPLVPNVPPEVQQYYFLLDHPLVAEAQSAGPNEDNVTVPGATMTASARDSATIADAVIGTANSSSFGTIGTTRATSLVALTGETNAEVDARSFVEHIELLDMITIGSVTSIAHVATDGLNATAEGSTRIVDMKINGTPVTVDGTGIHVADQSAPLDALTQGIHDALVNAQIEIKFTEPKLTKNRGAASYTAGVLEISSNGVAFRFGGAQAAAAATNAGGLSVDVPLPPVDGPGGGGAVDGGGGFAPTPPGEFGGTLPPPVAGGPLTPPGTSNNPVVILTREVAALPDGIKPLWVIVGLIGAFILSKGLVAMPARMLAGSSTPCPLEGKE